MLVGVINLNGFLISCEFPYTGILIAVVVGLLFGMLAALIPARQAANYHSVSLEVLIT